MSAAKHTPGPVTILIRFAKGHDNPNGTVSGDIKEASGWADPTAILGELHDVHPEFAAHIVKCVNLHSALVKAAQASPELSAAIAKATGSAS